MSSKTRTSKTTQQVKSAQLLALALNTSDISYLESAFSDDVYLTGDDDHERAQGKDDTLNFLENLLNAIGILHQPFLAEVARLQYSPRKYYTGVAIEIDDIISTFIAINTNQIGEINSVYAHHTRLLSTDPELSGDRPGFNYSNYESYREYTWAIRREKVRRLSHSHRPHFVAVLNEAQDSDEVLLILEELTEKFTGSTSELLIQTSYTTAHRNANNEVTNYENKVGKILNTIGSAGFPAIGVLLGQECIRPGYRCWGLSSIANDLYKMGISNTHKPCDEMNVIN